MTCVNCGHVINNGVICPFCKSDNILLKKAKTASLKLYNEGVVLAKNRDYSNAIDMLNRCIVFDKRNYVARNILGICYFEVGMPSDALKQWIVSSSIKSDKNPAVKYIESVQNNVRTLEKYNDAIKMYNKALTEFDAKREDIAVIQLKKAVESNNKFVEAYNLLALYYINKKDKTTAKTYIHKALSIDKSNLKALKYLSEISPRKSDKKKKKGSQTGYNENVDRSDSFKKYFRIEIITFILGALISFGAMLFLFLPARHNELTEEIIVLQEEIDRINEENLNGTSSFALKYSELEEENTKLKSENDIYKMADANEEQHNNYELAKIYVAGNEFLQAAELLSTLDVNNFTEEDKIDIENLKAEAYPQGAFICYESGINLFGNGNLDEALNEFVKAMNFGISEEFADNAMYYLAMIYEQKGDTEQAKEYYSRIINEYSESDIFSQSENKLKNLL